MQNFFEFMIETLYETLEGILGCVAVGLGWTLMPRRVIEQSPHLAELIPQAIPPLLLGLANQVIE